MRILKPRNSRPIRISHDPGDNGVNNAANPKMTRITPTIFRVTVLIPILSPATDA